MNSILRPAVVLFVVLSVITGLLYPAAITGIAQSLMPARANGSFLLQSGKPIGSSLIGQEFSDPKYFWGRLSATSPVPYTSFNADKSQGSAGSNLSPTNPDLVKNVQARIDALHAADQAAGYTRSEGMPLPVDLVTASASGLDPAISPAAAAYQAGRVAKARGIDEAAVRALVGKFTEQRQLGVLGEPGVNVLMLNLALDAEFPPKPSGK